MTPVDIFTYVFLLGLTLLSLFKAIRDRNRSAEYNEIVNAVIHNDLRKAAMLSERYNAKYSPARPSRTRRKT
jgi:hypothetical protein